MPKVKTLTMGDEMKQQVSTSGQRVVQPNGQQSSLDPSTRRQRCLERLERHAERADRNTGIVDDMVRDQLQSGEEVDIRIIREVFRGVSVGCKVDVAIDNIAHRAENHKTKNRR
jgi:hypothetical protein